MRAAAPFVAVACLSGCGTADEPAAEAEPAPATIRFEHSLATDGTVYIEGAIYHVTVQRGDETIADRVIDGRLTLDLPPGAYTLGSYAEVCNGNCDNLAAPSDRCSVGAELDDGSSRTASIVARPGDCAITLD